MRRVHLLLIPVMALFIALLVGQPGYLQPLGDNNSVSETAETSCKSQVPDAASCGTTGRDPDAATAETEEGEEEEAQPDEPDQAAKLRMLQDSDENGDIPENAQVEAVKHAKSMKNKAMPGAASDALKSAAGIDRSNWTWMGPGNVGGRIRSIVTHPTNSQTMWIGSVGGGIWKTTDGGASWQALDDFMANLAVSTMVIDPTNSNTLYAGTGEGVYNVDAIRGAGIFKTTDGGTTWSQLSSTATSDFQYVNRLAISPSNNQTLLAATRSGIWRSTDSGSTWSQKLAKTDNVGLLQVAFDPSDGNKAIASGNYGQAYYSTDGGSTWTAATKPWDTSSFNTRVELAYAPSSPSTVYASVNQGGGQIYKSTDGGHTYSQATTSSYNYLGSQGWYDNVIWVDPTNPSIVVVGGIDLWRSTNGGQTLTKISQWFSAPNSAHADQHAIVSQPGYNGTTNKTVLFGNDGGIYKAQDISTVSLTSGWQELNNQLGVTQFYGGAGNTTSGVVVGGAQDNGSLTNTGNTEGWGTMFGGDGGFSAADPNNQSYFYGEYVYANVHRSSNGGTSSDYISGQYWNGVQWTWKSAPYVIPDARDSTALFIAPFILDPNNSNTMLAGGQSLWRTNDVKTSNTNSSGPSWASIKGPVGTAYSDNISAIAVAPGNSDIIWVGYANGNVYKTTNGTSTSPTWTRTDLGTPSLPDRYVGRLTIDPRDSNKVYATFGGYSSDNVYRTTDGGSTWSDITGSGTTGLPDAPVRSLAVHPDNSNWLYVGTEVGVFASQDGGSTWSLPTDGPANVSVDELFWMGKKLVAATHGRGMFEADTTSSPSDTTAPTVQSSVPIPSKTGVKRGANISITFSEEMDKNTLFYSPGLSNAELYRQNSDGSFTFIPAAAAFSTDGKTITLNPDNKLGKKKWHQVVLWHDSTGLKDLAGNPLAAGGSYQDASAGYVYFWFKTGEK